MKIGIIGDIHSNLVNLEKALEKVKSRGISHVLIVGDLQNPDVCDILGSTNIKFSIVFGNADYDQEIFINRSKKFKNIEILGDEGDLDIGGKKIFICHYPEITKEALRSGKYDVGFSGHNHAPHEEKIKNALYIRPGEIAGQINEPTFCVFDLETMRAELVLVNK